jgi:hypothetical protein
MDVGQILGYVTAIANDWGIMPYIQAGIMILVAFGAFTALRRLLNGS